MPNGLYSRETFMNAQDKTQKGMLFDIMEGIGDKLDKVCELPAKCEATMDTKIKAANKRSGRFNIGLGGGSGIGAVGLWELFKNLFSNP